MAILDPAPFYQPPHVKFRMARLPDGECSASECSLICSAFQLAGSMAIADIQMITGTLAMAVSSWFLGSSSLTTRRVRNPLSWTQLTEQKVYDIIHPERRNLTAIRGYKRIGGLPDDPHTDPQDRSWYGPHDRLFTEEENDEMSFQPGPEYGTFRDLDRGYSPDWQFGVGVGTVLVTLTDPTWTLSGRRCLRDLTRKRRSL